MGFKFGFVCQPATTDYDHNSPPKGMHQGGAATNEDKSICLHRNQPGWVHCQG